MQKNKISIFTHIDNTPNYPPTVQCLLTNRKHFQDRSLYCTISKSEVKPLHIDILSVTENPNVKEILNKLASVTEYCIIQKCNTILTLKFHEDFDKIIKLPSFIGGGFSPTDIIPIRSPHHLIKPIRYAVQDFDAFIVKSVWWKNNEHLFPDLSYNDDWVKPYTLILSGEGGVIGNKNPSLFFRQANPHAISENNTNSKLFKKWDFWYKKVLLRRKNNQPFKKEKTFENSFFNNNCDITEIPEKGLEILFND